MANKLEQQGIYVIRCLADDKGTTYVGQSVNVRARLNKHRRLLECGGHGNKHLQSAWSKYGAGAFEVTVVERCLTLPQLVEREQYWLDFYRAQGPVYNYSPVARTPMLGRSRPDSVREAVRRARKGKPLSKAHVKKLSQSHMGQEPWNKGKEMTDAYKATLSAAQQKAYAEGSYRNSAAYRKGRRSSAKALRGKTRPTVVAEKIRLGVLRVWAQRKAGG